MKAPFSALILTLFPEMFPGMLGHSLAGKALEKGLWKLSTLQIRDFATDKHNTVDDTPYGGGAGMVMRADVLDAAITAARAKLPSAQLIYFTPRGVPLTQELVRKLVTSNHFPLDGGSRPPLKRTEGGEAAPAAHLASPLPNLPPQGGKESRMIGDASVILLCGRYEGVDQRVLESQAPLEISLGDYVLSGGEIAAQVLLDACVRLLPGVVGTPESIAEESFCEHGNFAGLLEYPQYTRPPVWDGRKVPDVLLSGNHADILSWRKGEAEKATQTRRPDLWKKRQVNEG